MKKVTLTIWGEEIESLQKIFDYLRKDEKLNSASFFTSENINALCIQRNEVIPRDEHIYLDLIRFGAVLQRMKFKAFIEERKNNAKNKN